MTRIPPQVIAITPQREKGVNPLPSTEVALKFINYAEAAALLGVPVGTLYAKVHHREIPHHRIGPRIVRFRLDELLAWLELRKVAPVTTAVAR